MNLLQDIKKNPVTLKPTVTKGGQANLTLIKSDLNLQEEDAKRREYFFQASVEKWYEKIPEKTFPSEFIPLSKEEAQAIITYWNNVTSKLTDDELAIEIPVILLPLTQKIQEIISTRFATYSGVFIKLSTRSPKDSKTIFQKAKKEFLKRLDATGSIRGDATSRENGRLVAFSEEMAKAIAVTTGIDALTILLDSWRVAEDLMYAFDHESNAADLPVSIVVRGWDPRINPKCEFRGFVWNYQMNAVGQYWHSLYFPDLIDLKEEIAQDLQRFFLEIRDSLPVPNAMLDLAWLGPNNVLLIEVNPLMEGLGSFKGSTGLFDYYEDQAVLTGEKPFEIRVRTQEESRAEILSHMSLDWRRVIYGF